MIERKKICGNCAKFFVGENCPDCEEDQIEEDMEEDRRKTTQDAYDTLDLF